MHHPFLNCTAYFRQPENGDRCVLSGVCHLWFWKRNPVVLRYIDIGRVIRLLLLVRFWLLVLVLVVMMLTPPPLFHLLWSLSCPLWLQLLMSSTRASLTMRTPCWRESSAPCTSSTRRGGDHLGVLASAATPPTSSPTVPRGRSSTPSISMTTTTEMTTARVTIRRRTASGTRRRSCAERVLPWVTLTSPMMTPPAQRAIRRSSASEATSPAFASWASLQETSPTLTPM
jgi:hypothetical protein